MYLPSVNPGKQGLEAAPSPTCRGHLESGPGTGTSDKNVARALNKGSQQGQPGRPYNHHHPHTSKTGTQGEVGMMLCQARVPEAHEPGEGCTGRGEWLPTPTQAQEDPDPLTAGNPHKDQWGTQHKSITAGLSMCRCLEHHALIASHHRGGLTTAFYRRGSQGWQRSSLAQGHTASKGNASTQTW